MFVVSVPILKLHSFSNLFWHGYSSRDIVQAVAINYHTIKRLHLDDYYDSSTTLLKFVECCRDIEELSFTDNRDILYLKRSDIEAIASLPRLKSLNIDCWIENDDAVSALSRCKGLKHLALVDGVFDLSHILPVIGKNLVSLDYTSSTAFLETVDAIVENCPNLQMLDLENEELDAVDLLKGGLKKLAKLNVNGGSVRLGTDWKGYR
jgi:Leucine-rich repeat (LRR) protein